MSKLALIGSGGFILSNFIRYLLFKKNPHSIVSIDRYNEEHQLNNIYINKGNKFYVADVTDAHVLKRIFQIEQPDVIIYGANSLDFHSNILAMQRVIECAIDQKIKRIIYLSTYERDAVDHYTLSHHTCENLLGLARINHSVLKLCDIVGPRQEVSARNGFIPQIINNVMHNQKTPVDDTIREWMHVLDVCGILANLITASDKIVDCSYGYGFSTCELYTEVCNVLGKGEELIDYQKGGNRVGYQQYGGSKVIDSLRPADPPYKFKDAVRATTQWYIDNAWFLR